MELLFAYFESKSRLILSDAEKELISAKFRSKHVRKRQYLLQEGDVCKYFSFIDHGAARTYSVDEKGNEHILHFGIEGWWMGDHESFTHDIPSRLNIDTFEDTHFLTITKDSLQELIEKIPAVAITIKTIYNQRAISAEKRIHAAISLTPEERFQELRATYPDFLQRFPLGQIASYLGISIKTLGRIRSGGK
ncbi:Crp/Fnr family transcriptional regulator [Chitinophaga filiformis]|uniref:cAMP-binding domain of CRP or a regulatory subunit of cAMP-dependent protein kinases n=1 Tax=Chitinophaga filiformis TaxID=104663 RepID=A0A1G7H0I9_CHIFI|nr:Crp/Fnr family transcriptional regulator [Chitinophaga filiformis]SDE93927.1 cAMP-binding domain of CRP or a regulatory subunit of cAMP-dependent protein kinases [Chitinophaga filiformis]